MATGAERFSRMKSTPVRISPAEDKLFIFEPKEDGILLGEALARKPFEKTHENDVTPLPPDELDRIIHLLSKHGMVVDRPILIDVYHRGITIDRATQIVQRNQERYTAYLKKMNQPEARKGAALFNAFILDCHKTLTTTHVPTYASHGDLS